MSEKVLFDIENNFLRDESAFSDREIISPTSPGAPAPVLIKSSVAAAESGYKSVWANVSWLKLAPASDTHLSTTLVHPRLARVK